MNHVESKLRRRLFYAAGWLTLLAALLGDGWLAALLAVATIVALMSAATYQGKRLFVTPYPERHPVGSVWRRYVVVNHEPLPDGFWLIRGERTW